ncbi:MAG TPA: zf-HC2 domain-containing protein, partial [Anaeromyxobacteraceae bacterium]|nr:zf-HC2 domain-containing protein [Anaeromyxobacteraceae bacterium]
MLTCRQVTELATDWSEGLLGAVDRRRVEEHLAGCDGCRAYLAQLTATAGALRRLAEPAVPPALEASLLAGFDAWQRERERAAAPRSPWWPALGLL